MAEMKAQMTITADASGVEAGVTKARKSLANLGQAAQSTGKDAAEGLSKMGDGGGAAAQKIDAATKNMIGSIQRTIAVMESGGRTSAKYFEVLAQQRGIDVSTLRPYLDQLDQVSAKQKQAGQEAVQAASKFNAYGKSAKEVQLALRGVPAQLTDIAVSLQGGQAPLTVLLQQGGQLRDMFGGIAPAAKALGSALVGIINPLTVTAGAAAALAAAYYQGSKEADAYAKALILTGNAAGASVSQLQAVAANVGKVAGTQSLAADVIAQLAATGKVGSAQLERVTESIVRLNRAGGGEAQDLVQKFAALGKEPVKASEKLNEQYGYLTLAVYEQIKALAEQGRVQEAAAVAQNAFADAGIDAASRIEVRLGLLERAWLDITKSASKAWDAMLGVGRAGSVADELSKAQARLKELQSPTPFKNAPLLEGIRGAFGGDSYRQQLVREQQSLVQSLTNSAKLEADVAKATGDRAAATKAAIEAEQVVERIRKGAMSNQQRMNADLKEYRASLDAIRKANANSPLLDPKKVQEDEAAIREKYRDKSQPKAYQDDAATRMLQQLREAESVSRAQLANTEKLTGAQKQLAEFEQLVADLKEKKTLTAEQKSLLLSREAIINQLRKNAGLEKEIEARDKITKAVEEAVSAQEKFNERQAQLRESMTSANDMRKTQYGEQVGAYGATGTARDELVGRQSIDREFQRYREQLDKATPAELLGTSGYKAAVAEIQAQLEIAKAAHADYFRQIRERQEDPLLGAKSAIDEYMDRVRRSGDATREAVTRALGGLEDTLTQFITTGKADFRGLVNTILSEFVRLNVIRPLMNSLMGASGGGVAGFFGSLFGGARASGGPVEAGKTYLVGEKGPELFTPGRSGGITPNNMLGGGASNNVSVNVTINQSGQAQSSVEASDAGARLGMTIKAAVQQALANESRQGGMLWRMKQGAA